MAGNQPGDSAMDNDGEKVDKEQLCRLIRELPKGKSMSITVKVEIRSEEAEAAILQKLKDYGFAEKLLETLKIVDLVQEDPNTRIVTARCEGNVTEEELINIAMKFPSASYQSFCRNLGHEASRADCILIKHQRDHKAALMEVLMDWRNRTSGPRTELECYLHKEKEGDLAKILYS